MPRYILSIIQPDGPAPSPEFLAPILKNLAKVNADMTAAGVRVMAAGLAPANEAFVVRGGRGRVARGSRRDQPMRTDRQVTQPSSFSNSLMSTATIS